MDIHFDNVTYVGISEIEDNGSFQQRYIKICANGIENYVFLSGKVRVVKEYENPELLGGKQCK